MFVDRVEVDVQAGDGGDGYLSFRHEKFIDKGGPDGGDGGDGGDVVALASNNQDTLANFRYKKLIKAEPGKAGFKRRMHGKNGKDLVVPLPVGTTVLDKEGTILADLVENGQEVIIAKGGKGGFGNAHFVSSTRQAPRVAEKGEAGEKLELILELRLIADVGIVGLPNAGKSTFLSTISNAKAEIADYPFTTLRPNLGVVDIDQQTTLLFADIPGLIEGASEGKGLGDEFLRHIERTKVLVHLIDAYEDVAKAYQTVQKELQHYRVDLTKRPQVVVINKIDGLDDQQLQRQKEALQAVVPAKTVMMAISAASGQGVDLLLYELKDLAKKAQKAQDAKKARELPVITYQKPEDHWEITKQDDVFLIRGKKIERFAARTDMSSIAGVQRLRDIMRKLGITRELERRGIQAGDHIKIGIHRKLEF
ncbi:MAG: GTPase ObgE [Candidatus Saccharibacteria bacterium]|nr:GTPase ObgE [Candidatus Saccharibacteria bacterium]